MWPNLNWAHNFPNVNNFHLMKPTLFPRYVQFLNFGQFCCNFTRALINDNRLVMRNLKYNAYFPILIYGSVLAAAKKMGVAGHATTKRSWAFKQNQNVGLRVGPHGSNVICISKSCIQIFQAWTPSFIIIRQLY